MQQHCENANSRGLLGSHTRRLYNLQLLYMSIFFIQVTIAATVSGIDDKNAFSLLEVKQPDSRMANVTCGASTGNDTFFVNPSYPDTDASGGTCDLIVDKFNESICQVRIDFLSFNLVQPDSEGFCTTDFMTVTGGTHSVPILCGYNVGQHIYVDVAEEGCSLRVLFDMDNNVQFPRLFNLQITQVPCTSVSRAPTGCLQYYTATSGNVQSFNFPPTPASAQADVRNEEVTRQISNTDYTVCIRPEDGYGSISWTPDPEFDKFTFFISGDENVLCDYLFGNIQSVETGEGCKNDYIIIPNAQWKNFIDDTVISDRFCGPAFPALATSPELPFELHVLTDSTESLSDVGNIGFSLNFRQNINYLDKGSHEQSYELKTINKL